MWGYVGHDGKRSDGESEGRTGGRYVSAWCEPEINSGEICEIRDLLSPQNVIDDVTLCSLFARTRTVDYLALAKVLFTRSPQRYKIYLKSIATRITSPLHTSPTSCQHGFDQGPSSAAAVVFR